MGPRKYISVQRANRAESTVVGSVGMTTTLKRKLFSLESFILWNNGTAGLNKKRSAEKLHSFFSFIHVAAGGPPEPANFEIAL